MESQQTPMMRQYLDIKAQHPDLLLFFRLGDFYEMFFEDAVVASRELEITLTSRNSDRDGKPIPMCGVPYHAVNSYLARLIKKGFKVAICEQVEDPSQARGIVRREVTRIVTPGTAVEEGILNAGENNYLAAVNRGAEGTGLAFADLSTGEFWLSEIPGSSCQDAKELIAHFRPSEIVVSEEERDEALAAFSDAIESGAVESPQAAWTFQFDYARRTLLDHFQVSTLEGFGIDGRRAAVGAGGALLSYLKQTQRTALPHINQVRLFEPHHFLQLDEATVNNLELVRGTDGNRRWTLLGVLDSTCTGMGARLFRNWLLRPSLDLGEIGARHQAVEELRGKLPALSRLRKTLSSILDLERLLGRAILETASPRDLLALKTSFQVLPDLIELVGEFSGPLLNGPIDPMEDLAGLLERAIDPEAPIGLSDGRVIRTGYRSDLDEYRAISRSGKSHLAALEAKEREQTGISNLKVKYNRVFGYFIEVTKSQLQAVPEHYVRRQTLVGSERFITPELKEYEDKVLNAEERMIALEKELFAEIRGCVAKQAQRIRATAERVAVIDVLANFAEVSHRYGYVRPSIDEGTELRIQGGRHPVLERQAGEPFVPNDLYCNTESDQLLILTGPNMGGKSTFLRQNALIVVMAQMGCFVPASETHLGLVDRIYTRVGASDNLARGRSTFMVEMIETANILNTATPRSLILLDEVGRGTATFDGLALAWSIAEFLHIEPSRRARTIFATHYQELTKLESLYPGVRNYCVNVRESNGRIIFFHRVVPGVANRSYGIEVARLAGLPGPVLQRAREILGRLERKDLNLSGQSRVNSTDEVMGGLQRALF